jgi:hypothetical protein
MRVLSTLKKGVYTMATIFHEGHKLLRQSFNDNHSHAFIADFLYFRISGSKYNDDLGKFFLLPNIDHLSESTGFGKTTCSSSLSELEKNGFITKVKLRCYDNAVRTKIYITQKFQSIMNEIASLKNNASFPKQILLDAIPDLPQNQKSDLSNFGESFIKEQTIKENNIVKSVVGFKEDSNITKSNLIDITNTPNFTKDTGIKTDITDNQINAISDTAEEYKVDPCKLFDSVMESLDRTGGLFDNYNQLLATSINKQLAMQVDEQAKDNVRGQCKYNIDFNSTELANDDRLDELDKSQQYAIEHNLKYLQNFKGKRFDMSEMTQWVSHSLTCGYKGLGFKKAIRCIVRAIKDDKYTRPWSLKSAYLV